MDRNLALKDLFARKLANSALSLGRGGQVDESVAHGAVGTGILGNGNRLAKRMISCPARSMKQSGKPQSDAWRIALGLQEEIMT